MDSQKCQTVAASPAEPGELPVGLVQVGAALALLIAGLAVWARPFDFGRLYEADSYSSLGFQSITAGIAFRAGHCAMACVLGYAVLCLIPRAEGRLTQYGTRTLAMLVVHPLFVLLLRKATSRIEVLNSVFVLAAFAVGVTWLSGTEPAHRLVSTISRLPEKLVRAR